MEQGFDLCCQFGYVEGFGQVVVGVYFQIQYLVQFVVFGGQYQYWYIVWVGVNFLVYCQVIQFGQYQIQDYQINFVLVELFQFQIFVINEDGLYIKIVDLYVDQFIDVGIVFNNENGMCYRFQILLMGVGCNYCVWNQVQCSL